MSVQAAGLGLFENCFALGDEQHANCYDCSTVSSHDALMADAWLMADPKVPYKSWRPLEEEGDPAAAAAYATAEAAAGAAAKTSVAGEVRVCTSYVWFPAAPVHTSTLPQWLIVMYCGISHKLELSLTGSREDCGLSGLTMRGLGRDA